MIVVRRSPPRLFAALAVAFFSFSGTAVLAQNNQDAEADVTPVPSTVAKESLPPGASTATTYPESGVPRIYPRGVWEGFEFSGGAWQPTESLRPLLKWLPQPDNAPPDYSAVERMIVHDQGCLNPVTCTQNAEKFPIQTIQGIFRSHAVTRGWGDIGYNYIIDRQGRIFEGRYGGNGVRAAHTYADARCENLNVATVGVLLLGDLRGGPMTQAQSESLARLAAWLGAVNGVDMSAESVTTTTWVNPRRSTGGCDVSRGGFTGTLTAPRFASHGDVEPGNSDRFDLSRERLAAKPFQETYAVLTYHVEENATASAFSIRGGALQEEAQPSGTVATIAQTQVDLFPRSSVSTLPDGSLVKSRTRPRVYAIENGARRAIPSVDLFEARGYRWDSIQEVSDRELALLRLGAALPYPDNFLVKGSGEPVYVFEGGKLRHITSAALFNTLKYAWSSIHELFDQDVDQYPKGEPKIFPNGTLVKGVAPRVYEVQDGKRRPILSAGLFTALGKRWQDIQALEDGELDRYAEGAPLPWPDGSLVRAEGTEQVYLVQGGFRRWIQTADAFRALGYGWNNIRIVSVGEVAALREAQPIASVADRNATPQPIAPLPTPPPSPMPTPLPTPSPTPVPTPLPVLSQEPVMRVGLAIIGAGSVEHSSTNVSVSYDVAATIKRNGVAEGTLQPGESRIITPSAGIVWRIEPVAGGIATVHSYTDPAWSGSNDNRFRGIIEVQAAQDGAFWLINELPIEEYMKGIAETINGDPAEYGKAFAIAARSYAFYYIEKGGKRAGEPFHLRRTPADQLYKGYSFELRASDPVVATSATRGAIAAFNGKPILAAYSSGAPGPTRSACEALSSAFCNNPDFTYLAGGVADPPDTQYRYQSCGGAVHCAGIDAAGARRMAELGSTAAQILTAYYPGITTVVRW